MTKTQRALLWCKQSGPRGILVIVAAVWHIVGHNRARPSSSRLRISGAAVQQLGLLRPPASYGGRNR